MEMQSPENDWLQTIRPASWGAIVFVVVANLLILMTFLIWPAALAGCLNWLIVICGGMLMISRLRWLDLGLPPDGLLPGLLFLPGLWILVQGGVLLIGALAGAKITWHTPGLGLLVWQMIFFALAEEILFRGFLFPQLAVKFKGGGRTSGKAWLYGLLASQVIFALSHFPSRLAERVPWNLMPFDLLLTMTWGIFFCYLYARSRNLLIPAGTHALANFPTLGFGQGALPWFEVGLIVGVSALLMMEIWLALRHRAASLKVTDTNIDRQDDSRK